MKKRISIIWTIDKNKFVDLVKQSYSIGEICKKLELRNCGSTFKTIQKRINEESLSTIHFVDHRKSQNSMKYIDKHKFLILLSSNSLYNRNDWIKKKLLEFELLKNKCDECKLGPEWNDKLLVLHLDHKDGDRYNNTLTNFRLLCPNCHSQTETYSMGKRKRTKYLCSVCLSETSGYSNVCHSCKQKTKRKVIRPEKEELSLLVKTIPMTQLSKKFGVSDNSIRKWCKTYGIETSRGRGYWSQTNACIV